MFTDTACEESSYYVSLFTIYKMGGREIVSNPKPCRVDRPLSADVFWKVGKNLLGGLKLEIEVNGNRPMARIPEFTLCACVADRHLLSSGDTQAKRLIDIKSVDLGSTPQKTYKSSYDIKFKLLKGSKLFLFKEAALPSETFTLRWAKGFKGKV